MQIICYLFRGPWERRPHLHTTPQGQDAGTAGPGVMQISWYLFRDPSARCMDYRGNHHRVMRMSRRRRMERPS